MRRMFHNAFPSSLGENLNKVIETMPNKTFNNVPFATSDNIIAYTFEKHVVDIPYRMYLLDISDAEYEKLSQTKNKYYVVFIQEVVTDISEKNTCGNCWICRLNNGAFRL